MSISTILSQVVITVVVVGLYHLWASGKKEAGTASPALPTVPAPAAPPPKPVSVPAPAPASAPEQTPAEVMAVIAAAIAVVLGRPHRVVAVERAASGPEISVWALEGRVEQFMSHKIR
jgi:hypothetical protein